MLSCISFDSYIKPQQIFGNDWRSKGCISFDSYIKPQHQNRYYFQQDVVYLLIPTSNHNLYTYYLCFFRLYIF